MAYKKISDLTTASGYAAGDLIEMESAAGASVKSTFINAMLGNDGLDSSLEAGDAGKVSRFGIGTYSKTLTAPNADSLQDIKNGIYYVDGGSNFPASSYGTLSIFATGVTASDYAFYLFSPITSSNTIYIRIRSNNINSAWGTMWTSGNDGNAGQPPAPKPRAATDSDIGQYKTIRSGDNTNLALPSGGIWQYIAIRYNNSTSAIDFNNSGAGVDAGGTTLVGGASGFSSVAFVWRIS